MFPTVFEVKDKDAVHGSRVPKVDKAFEESDDQSYDSVVTLKYFSDDF